MQGKYITFFKNQTDDKTGEKWVAGVKYRIEGEENNQYTYGKNGYRRVAKSDEDKTYEIGFYNTSNNTRE